MSETTATPKTLTRRRVVRWAVEGALGVSVFAGLQHCQTRSLLDAGTLAPDFEGQTLDGEVWHLSQFHGSRIFLHFWATWCGVCKQEIGMLNRLASDLPEATRLLAVTTDDELPRLRQFATDKQLQYPILLAPAEVLSRYRIRSFPTNYVIDTTGRVASATVGMSAGWAVRSRLSCAG